MSIRKTTVLFVEDDDLWREAMCRLLRNQGYATIEAVNGKVAIDDLEALTPDCVILDLMMPVVSGEGVLRNIREHGLKTRVVVVTGAPFGPIWDRVAALNPDAMLAKPMSLETLVAAIGPATRDETP